MKTETNIQRKWQWLHLCARVSPSPCWRISPGTVSQWRGVIPCFQQYLICNQNYHLYLISCNQDHHFYHTFAKKQVHLAGPVRTRRDLGGNQSGTCSPFGPLEVKHKLIFRLFAESPWRQCWWWWWDSRRQTWSPWRPHSVGRGRGEFLCSTSGCNTSWKFGIFWGLKIVCILRFLRTWSFEKDLFRTCLCGWEFPVQAGTCNTEVWTNTWNHPALIFNPRVLNVLNPSVLNRFKWA